MQLGMHCPQAGIHAAGPRFAWRQGTIFGRHTRCPSDRHNAGAQSSRRCSHSQLALASAQFRCTVVPHASHNANSSNSSNSPGPSVNSNAAQPQRVSAVLKALGSVALLTVIAGIHAKPTQARWVQGIQASTRLTQLLSWCKHTLLDCQHTA